MRIGRDSLHMPPCPHARKHAVADGLAMPEDDGEVDEEECPAVSGGPRRHNRRMLTLSGTVDSFPEGMTIAGGGASLSQATVNTADFRIDSEASVTGAGSLSGNLYNNGTLSAGNSPGMIHVGGNFTQAATGRMISEVLPSGYGDTNASDRFGGRSDMRSKMGGLYASYAPGRLSFSAPSPSVTHPRFALTDRRSTARPMWRARRSTCHLQRTHP